MRKSPHDEQALSLTGLLESFWPEVFEQLADRATIFCEAARRKAVMHRLVEPLAVDRYVNLCLAIGPNFEDKLENEWALAILRDERLIDMVRAHQLVVQGRKEMLRRSLEMRQISERLGLADAAILDLYDARARAADADAVGVPRVACDLEAVEIRLVEFDWRREYRRQNGAWALVPVEGFVNAVRIVPGNEPPELICVLTHSQSNGPRARLQVRSLVHAQCQQDRHPLVSSVGDHGLTQWRGSSAKNVSWEVLELMASAGRNDIRGSRGLGVMTESVPDTSLLHVATCGLRDNGVPVGAIKTCVWAYPADQWLFTIKRGHDSRTQWPRPTNDAPLPAIVGSVCLLERDGDRKPLVALTAEFDQDMRLAVRKGLDDLFVAWQASTTECSMLAQVSLLGGEASLTWGWREAAMGIAERPFLRAVGHFDMESQLEVQLIGFLDLDGTRTRVTLVANGNVSLIGDFAREQEMPGLFEVFLPVVQRAQLAFRVECEPLALVGAAAWTETVSCQGAVLVEVGFKPRTNGGGWHWYARVRSEPVSVHLCLADPVLGRTYKTFPMLPSIGIVDWSSK
jgi:hypothetical protein